MPQFEYLRSRLDHLDQEHRRRRLLPRQIEGTRLITEDRSLHNFGGNDYLGLAAECVGASSSGSGASALVCGWTESHQQLADQLARFEATEAAVVFPSGFAACIGTIATLAEDGDLILSDELNHASLIDGCRLSRAQRIIYPHRDTDSVEQTLKSMRDRFNRVWILTDAVFSMDGHLAPLPQLADLAERYDSHLLVDEAHGTGVLGTAGRGACESLNVKDRVSVRIGTLSKAVGSQGGFVAGPSLVIDYLINRCRTLIYSTALAPASVQAATSNLQKIENEPDRRERLHRLAVHVRERLGLHSAEQEKSVPIIPVILGEDARALDAAQKLAELGFYVPAIRPPTVPKGSARLRISLSATHDPADVDTLCDHLLTCV
ncbi:MAG: 8-amino-7-oxononanoate synthase [Planctomycetota bacterium]